MPLSFSVQPVAVIPEYLVYPAVPHEAPHHAPLSSQIIPHKQPPPKNGQKKSTCCQTLFICCNIINFFSRLKFASANSKLFCIFHDSANTGNIFFQPAGHEVFFWNLKRWFYPKFICWQVPHLRIVFLATQND